MSTVFPKNIIDQITFCEAHNEVWASAGAAIGVAPSAVTALTTATTNARKAYNDAQAAREASKAATVNLHSMASIMASQCTVLIAQIKAFAEAQAVPMDVYTKAQIPPPAAPTPAPAPGKPTDFAVGLNPDGSVNLSWMASDSAASTGAFFSVSRKLPGQSGFMGIGGAPGSTSESRRCSFTDATVPASAAGQGAQYIVQGFRGTRVGDASDAVTVQFGVDSTGGAQFTSAQLKMAA
ncbi:MAG TPA: hypothetical protein VHC70_06955 [Phycisphaerales bacterium]|nr:hypothetical protein [Phycisphaerales bacterium]